MPYSYDQILKSRDRDNQQFQEELLADRGFRFVKKEGDDMIWETRRFSMSFKTTYTQRVRVKKDGKLVYE